MAADSGPRTVGEAVDAAARRLDQSGVPGPRREAEALMGHLLGTDRGGVVARQPDSLPCSLAARFEELLERRSRREPLQYLTGEQEFHGLVLRVDRRALIPRPETEGLVDAVLRLGLPRGARIADLGTGSGCIAVALATARPDVEVHALDSSIAAIELARENAAAHGVVARIVLRIAAFSDPATEWVGLMDAVVSNPPYVSEEEWKSLAPEVRDYEPKEALVPGPTGLEAYRALAQASERLLRPGGALVLELGYRSEAGAREAVERAGFRVLEIVPDPRGIPRVLVARRGEEA